MANRLDFDNRLKFNKSRPFDRHPIETQFTEFAPNLVNSDAITVHLQQPPRRDRALTGRARPGVPFAGGFIETIVRFSILKHAESFFAVGSWCVHLPPPVSGSPLACDPTVFSGMHFIESFAIAFHNVPLADTVKTDLLNGLLSCRPHCFVEVSQRWVNGEELLALGIKYPVGGQIAENVPRLSQAIVALGVFRPH